MLYEISIILGVAKIKGIQLKNIVKPLNNSCLTEQKCFQIVLGSDYNVKCQSLRYAKRFLAETNRLLNQKVNLLCSCATKVCNVYYIIWPYLRENSVKEFLAQTARFNRSLYMAVTRCQLPNGNFFVFSHLRNACIELKASLDLFVPHTRRGDSVKREILALQTELDQILLFLNAFPVEPFSQLLSPEISSKIKVTRRASLDGFSTDIRD